MAIYYQVNTAWKWLLVILNIIILGEAIITMVNGQIFILSVKN
jgi:hypothetical protein